MATSKAKTVTEYLASLPKDRREEIAAVRDVVRKNLPRGFEEGMQYGMISWFVPLSRFEKTYNGQPFATASGRRPLAQDDRRDHFRVDRRLDHRTARSRLRVAAHRSKTRKPAKKAARAKPRARAKR